MNGRNWNKKNKALDLEREELWKEMKLVFHNSKECIEECPIYCCENQPEGLHYLQVPLCILSIDLQKGIHGYSSKGKMIMKISSEINNMQSMRYCLHFGENEKRKKYEKKLFTKVYTLLIRALELVEKYEFEKIEYLEANELD